MYVHTLSFLIPLQWELHTFYLFWSDFHGENHEKSGGGGGGVYLLPEKKTN